MGQIQNALNQIFTSALGSSLAMSHSPYVRGQQAIKQEEGILKAQKKYSSALEAVATSRTQEAVEANKLLRKPENQPQTYIEAKEALAEARGANTDTLKNQLQLSYEAEKAQRDKILDTTMRVGTKRQQQIAMLEKHMNSTLLDKTDPTPEDRADQAVSELAKAYNRKKAILEGVARRRYAMTNPSVDTELL